MTHTQPSYAMLAVAPYPSTPKCAEPAIVTGFSLLHIIKLSAGDFRFALHIEAANTLSDEPRLSTQFGDILPHPTFWIGSEITAHVLTPLQRAADRQPPVIGAHLRQRLARLEPAMAVSIAVPKQRIVDGMIGNAIADNDVARHNLEQCAIDDWMCFLLPRTAAKRQPAIGFASIATLMWLAARARYQISVRISAI
jgi:hypothetical protein